MVNNFEQISEILVPKEQNEFFYHLQIIRRGKDHPSLPSANRTIQTYFITSAEHLAKVKDEIIQLCELFKARAYINLAEKSVKKLGRYAAFNLAERIYTGDYKHIWKVFQTAAGEITGKEARWIVDVDDVENINESELREYINEECDPKGVSKVLYKIPTRSGYHLITTGFNLQQFRMKYARIDVHKNNPTILYIPESLSWENS